MSHKRIYLDNAATTFPKPESVVTAVTEFMTQVGCSSGRAAHDGAIAAGSVLFDAREKLASLLGVNNPMRVIFTGSATEALNQAILGTLKQGDHVITTEFEHNSTIRPLKALQQQGVIELTIAKAVKTAAGKVFDYNLASLEACLKPNTRAVVFNHSSNVFGNLLPLLTFAQFASKHNLLSICDASQSVGTVPIDISATGIDLIAFPAHKGLYGPMGLGALVINDEFDISQMRPLKFGGTGSLSDKVLQPDFLPDKYESGTHNMPAIAGLNAALGELSERGIVNIAKHKQALVEHFYQLAAQYDVIETYLAASQVATGTISFNLRGISSSEVGYLLAENYQIDTRIGLHCAPLAHQALGTYPQGTVRVSFSMYSTTEDVESLVVALNEIAAMKESANDCSKHATSN
ncbi:aminotransferase class V-fold PLP-dependent enzyme [Shewanella maritima]|uniref:cysteine desulfurase n=1 Tax=Shewanella maritima TaxID=2520507 RepID=A0A411PGC0_9GAMM|nr:aminotransferase class V-fold PLP-dependent enzyme [Shewanella maritima]QBF82646.1 aminotransferase class V-fold PLP-dependent enzyme [Shewanella maritima]